MTAVASLVVGRSATTPAAQRAAAVVGALLLAGANVVVWAMLGAERQFLVPVVVLCAATAAVAVGAGVRLLRFDADEVASGSTLGRQGRAIGVMVLVAGLLGVGAFAVAGNADTCSGDETATIRVGVAPEIEQAVTQAVERFNDTRQQLGGTCVQAEATAANPADVAALLSQPSPSAPPPDVWIPDSTLWASLLRPGAEGRKSVESTETSLAQSPLVVAMSNTAADALRNQGAAADPAWTDLIAASGQGADAPPPGEQRVIPLSQTQLQVPDPARNASGLATLVIASHLQADEPSQPDTLTSRARTLRTDTVPDVAAGFAAFRTSSEGPYPALVAPEQAVFAYNQTNPAEPALAVYPRGGTMMMDYPYIITATDTVKADGARLLEAEIGSETTKADVRALGFRSADGTAPAAFGPQPEPAPQPLPAPPIGEVHKAVQTWRMLDVGIRTLALVDITSSMGEPIGPGLTRLQATAQATETAFTPMPDNAEVGIWLFAHQLGENKSWAELVSLGRLDGPFGPATRRDQVKFGLEQIRAIPEPQSGLYDTVLAAFRAMNSSYDPERANSILLFTDGTNDAAGATPLPDLLTALRAEYDPTRPVQVVIVGYGDKVDRGALEQIAGATNGNLYLANTPEQADQIRQVLLTDLTRRPTAQ